MAKLKEKEKEVKKETALIESNKRDIVKEAAGKRFLTESQMNPADIALMHQWAQQEGIPPTGITILGGKPYVNVTGLDSKMFKFEEKIGKRVRRKMSVPIHRATEKDLSAGYLFIIEFEDDPERETKRQAVIMECVKANKSAEEIKIIVEEMGLSAPIFKAEGWADQRSVKMSTMHNPSCMNMLAERRASNRCKREVVGCGLTSLDEMPFGFEQFLDRKGNKDDLEEAPPTTPTAKVKANDVIADAEISEEKKDPEISKVQDMFPGSKVIDKSAEERKKKVGKDNDEEY